jgi:hypothetical protein
MNYIEIWLKICFDCSEIELFLGHICTLNVNKGLTHIHDFFSNSLSILYSSSKFLTETSL